MNDMIIRAAQDPSCILAVTPDRGGSWWATLRPDTPRNFKKTGDVSWTWTGFSAASNVIGSDDFEFEVIYRLNALQSTNYIFYHSNTQGSVNVGFTGSSVYLTMGRVQNPETGTRKNAGALQSDFAELSAIGEWVSVVIRRVSGVLSLILNGRTTNTTTVDQTDVWYSDFDPISNFDGNMRSAKLVNLTTGETVWSASRDDLFETNNPWPSATLRNFAEEPAEWIDAITAANQIGSDDWSFQITMNVLSQIEQTSGEIFNNDSGSPLKIYGDLIASGSAAFYLRNYVELETWTGTHRLQLDVVSGNATLYVDGTLVATKPTGLSTLNFTRASKTSADIEIESVEFLSLTTGRTVWSYPSEAERVRLITKTNVRTDRGAFEAADETATARVDTALDLRGKVSSYTVVVDFEAIAPDGTQSKLELAGQGASVTGLPSICALAQSGSTGNIQLSQEINGSRQIVYKAPNKQLGRHVAVGVVDVGNSSTRLAVYYDGGLLAEDTFDGLPAGTCDPRAVNWAIFDNRNGGNTMRYGKIYSALLFDRALTAAEIAALCPTSN